MRILGRPSATKATVVARVASTSGVHPRFVSEMLPQLWDAACFHAIDPVVMVAQSYKETGGGNFTGQVKPWFHNPCGLKVTTEQQSVLPGVTDGDNPLAHAMFPNWTAGAIAHAQHLRAYTGALLPPDSLILSPRYPLVVAANKPVAEVESLSTRWAPSTTYGAEIVTIARRLQTTT